MEGNGLVPVSKKAIVSDHQYKPCQHLSLKILREGLTPATATAQLALLKITIATQQALLDGLTRARDDDGIIDFDYCVDTSDKVRNEALLALHQLFQRKLEEEMQKKRSVPFGPTPDPEASTSSPPHQQAVAQRQPQLLASSEAEEGQPNLPPPKIKKSRTFVQVVFRRKSNDRRSSFPSTSVIPESNKSIAPSPKLSREVTKQSVNRKNTTSSICSDATWSSSSSDSSVGGSGFPDGCNPSVSAITAASRHDTALSTMSSMSGTTVISAVSSTSNMSLSPITKYGACCKYAYELREGNIKKGLMLQLDGFYVGQAFYGCASSKCGFRAPVTQDKNGYKMDTRVSTSVEGIQFRWLFLAKSHVQQPESGSPAYRCLVCVLSKDDSAIYHGKNTLFAHLADHQGARLGNVSIAGRLIFNNYGPRSSDDANFDVKFPEVKPIEPPLPDQGIAVVVAATPPLNAHSLARSIPAKGSSMVAYTYEPDDNPWVS